MRRKVFDAIQMEDFMSLVILSNEHTLIPIKKDDRRFDIYKCSDKKKDIKYFNQFAKKLEDNEVVRHFYTYLKTYNLSNFDIHDINSDDKDEMLDDMKEDHELYILNYDYSTPIQTTVLYEKYKNNKNLNSDNNIVTKRTFLNSVGKLCMKKKFGKNWCIIKLK